MTVKQLMKSRKQLEAKLKKLNDQGEIEKLCDKYADQGISYSNWLIK